MSRRTFAAIFLGVTLLIAGVASYYASAHPDGLEAVAEKTGFADRAGDHRTADGPLADYQTKGVDNERVSGGLAGVIGVGVTLAVAGGLFWVVRRRGDAPQESALDDEQPSRLDRDSARHDGA